MAPRPVDAVMAEAPAAPAPEKKTSSVGIIYPPPEVRNIVDKTASFVARNGPEFEQRIKQKASITIQMTLLVVTSTLPLFK